MKNTKCICPPALGKVFIGVSFMMLGIPALAAGEELSGLPAVKVTAPQQTTKTVSGVIEDSFGPVAGANIVVKGTMNGMISDMEGKFTLTNVPAEAVLQVSYIGYLTQEIKLAPGQRTLTIRMEEDSQALEEVVVVGYGTQKKVNLSGAVAAVDVAKMTESRPINSLSTALAGMAAGVRVSSSKNAPGESGVTSIRIRGQGTLNNASPLVVIDGVEGSLDALSPNEVESMSVLKDAASAAIYGSRAANGVILVTTKKGKKDGGVKFDYNGYLSIDRPTRLPETVSDYATYMELINEGYENSGMGWPYKDDDGNGIADKAELWRAHPNDPINYPNTDPFEVLFGNTRVSQQHSFAVSGGNEKVTHYTSFTYLNNPGVVENTDYERYSVRSNIDLNIKKWFRAGTNLSGYYGSRNINANSLSDVFNFARQTSPAVLHRHPDGRYGNTQNDEESGNPNNVLTRLNQKEGENLSRNMKARFYATLEPLEGLTFTGSYSYVYTDNEQWSKPVFIDEWDFRTEQITKNGTGRTSVNNKTTRSTRNFMDIVGRYENKFFDNRLDLQVMAGASQEKWEERKNSATKYDLLDPALDVINGATGEASASGEWKGWAMRSYFGRINLGWLERYLVEFNLRSDGSSRFHPDKRWGYFPSGSVAWRISEEAFMKEVGWLSNLKIRASYGSLGNNSVGNYDAVSAYEKANYILGGGVNMGLSQGRIANTSLTWESTYVANAGIDFGALNNRLTSTIDVFNKRTANILIDLPAPAVHGEADVPKKNSAEVVNNGFEFTVGWQDRVNDFSYYVNGNLTYIKNKVTKFGDTKYAGNRIIQEGLPIQTLYLIPTDGIIQDKRDLEKVNALLKAEEERAAAAGEKPRKVFHQGTPGLGDILYKDTNKDGIINSDDRVTFGHGTSAPVTFGLNAGVSWKGFDVSILLQGTFGLETVYQGAEWQTMVKNGYMLSKEIVEGRWHEGLLDANGYSTGKAKFPRLLEQSNKINSDSQSDFWLVSQDYLRVKNLQFGYTFPKTLVNKIYLERVRLYCSLENFFTLTDYPGLDPESGWGYPAMKQASFGVNVTF